MVISSHSSRLTLPCRPVLTSSQPRTVDLMPSWQGSSEQGRRSCPALEHRSAHPHTLIPSHPKQVSSLSIELMTEKNVSEELRNQLTLARANLARHRSQTSSSPSQSTPYPAIADSKPPPVTPASNPRPPGSGAGSKKALVINL